MDEDNFHLMDNAKAVSTITGTVAMEAYARKKPVILFGRSLLEVEGVHIYQNMELLNMFIKRVHKNDVKIKNVIDSLTELCSKNNISGLDLSTREEINYYKYHGFEEKAHYDLLTEVLVNNN